VSSGFFSFFSFLLLEELFEWAEDDEEDDLGIL
jgi:hypothetical protein